ncbi:DivIVA domain-containing protein [Spelaeicoccus albus]|uniref:DivIVA domain-containing protein n=2 Tax=Spelaeicoccus albus TaxID=1280376 RepID=A0A7Z0D3B6_9MICO|nr:DivIVA domain-containing protein [Spelaeicoccus albus]NYI68080.1 DivIVA domain-containing protein [Spelaeicoccus albus]
MSIWIVLGMCAAAVVVVLAIATGVGAIRGGLEPPVETRPVLTLPAEPTAADIHAVRFSLAFRGYRMDQVDAVLARLSDRVTAQDAALAEQDERIAALERQVAGGSC